MLLEQKIKRIKTPINQLMELIKTIRGDINAYKITLPHCVASRQRCSSRVREDPSFSLRDISKPAKQKSVSTVAKLATRHILWVSTSWKIKVTNPQYLVWEPLQSLRPSFKLKWSVPWGIRMNLNLLCLVHFIVWTILPQLAWDYLPLYPSL